MNNRNKYEINMFNIKKINNSLSNRNKLQTNLNNLHKFVKNSKLKNKTFKNYRRTKYFDKLTKNIILKNINKYNSTPNKQNLNIINNLIKGKITHFKSILKDNRIINNNSEYLKRFYKRKEINEQFPKFYIYYKNYFKFFLKPTLSDFYYNDLLMKNGNTLAQDFYDKHKTKKVIKKNKKQKFPICNKKILISKIIEKDNNNLLSLNLSNENCNNQKNKIYSESSISLLSIINLINNNTSRNNFEKDYIKKKFNLFLDLKKDNKSNNKSQKSTAVLTPTNNQHTKIINDFIITQSKQKIKKQENLHNNIFLKNNNNHFICLSERATIEKKSEKNNHNNHIFIRDKIQSQKNNKIFRSNNFIANLKNKLKEFNINEKKQKIEPYILKNDENRLFYNFKGTTSYSPTIQDVHFLTTQMSNRKSDFQTQINKVFKKSPNFKNKINNNIERIKSKNINFNMSLSNKNINSLKKYYRNDFFSKSLIYYQKLKKEKNKD